MTKTLLHPLYLGDPKTKPWLEAILFSPNDKLLVAKYAYITSTMRYFDLETKREFTVPATLRSALETQFTPDGRALMLTTLEGLQFWGLSGRNVFSK